VTLPAPINTGGRAASSFPRRQAITRRFTLGAPRNITVTRDGGMVVFLRSSAGDDPNNSIWALDVESGEERLVFDPATLAVGTDLPAAELARRERARESGGGVVGYSQTADGFTLACAVGGQVIVIDAVTGSIATLDSTGEAFDPVISPDGSHVAYVSGSSLRLTSVDGDRLLIDEPGDTFSWGSAEFVAGEEMGRTRGFWWSPGSDRLLVERVDVARVDQWWIAAPVTPELAPRSIRYPAAGTPNADVSLAIVTMDGGRADVDWSADEWEYLAGAEWSEHGLILTVQSRDQRTLAVLDVDTSAATTSERQRVTDPGWVELIPGVPTLSGRGLVTIEDRGEARRLCLDGAPLTGDDLQVRRLIAADDDGAVIAVSLEPTSIGIARVSWEGEVEWMTPTSGVHSAVVAADTVVTIGRSLDHDGAITAVRRGGSQHTLTDNSETPDMSLNLSLHRLGPRRLAAALLLPQNAAPDVTLPVLLDPYGGPHAQRVMQSRSAFHASQWFADQGFAVLVVDGRGTPGRGPEFEREVRGDLAGPVLEDQIDALRAAAEIEPRLDLSRVAIRGWSFGGYLAALAVLRRPDLFHAAVAGAPVTDWRLYDTHYTERYLGDPRHEPHNYAGSGLAADITRPTPDHPVRPLMLIHGLADDNVVSAHTLRLSRSLLEVGRPHTVLPLSGVTHMTPQEEVAENLLVLQAQFLIDAVGGPSGPIQSSTP